MQTENRERVALLGDVEALLAASSVENNFLTHLLGLCPNVLLSSRSM